MENEIMEIENEEMMVHEEPEKTGNGMVGKIVAGVGIAALGAAALWLYKTKEKREAKKIEKLRAKGYVIQAPDEIEEVIDAEIVD